MTYVTSHCPRVVAMTPETQRFQIAHDRLDGHARHDSAALRYRVNVGHVPQIARPPAPGDIQHPQDRVTLAADPVPSRVPQQPRDDAGELLGVTTASGADPVVALLYRPPLRARAHAQADAIAAGLRARRSTPACDRATADAT